jgi:hypothetical protein
MVISFFSYRLLSYAVGVLYPSYQTYKALKYQCYDQYPSLLAYWLVFSLLQIYEYLFDPLLALLLPFYYELKLCLIFWLSSRSICHMIFQHGLLTMIDKYEKDIDYLLNHTIHRLAEWAVKGLLFAVQQQRFVTHVDSSSDTPRFKTNFASQYRRVHSFRAS